MSILAWRLRVDEVGAKKTLPFRAPDSALVALAQAIGVDRVLSCEANFYVTPTRDDAFDVTGTVTARVVQTCVVTLEPFETDIKEKLAVRFAAGVAARESTRKHVDAEADEEGSSGMVETPEPIVDGGLDLGAVAQEFLALAVDPYPRKPGAAFASADPGDAPPSPFAALATLRSRSDTGTKN